jgi:hypothetical protein
MANFGTSAQLPSLFNISNHQLFFISNLAGPNIFFPKQTLPIACRTLDNHRLYCFQQGGIDEIPVQVGRVMSWSQYIAS